jgi:hypothetical protein
MMTRVGPSLVPDRFIARLPGGTDFQRETILEVTCD